MVVIYPLDSKMKENKTVLKHIYSLISVPAVISIICAVLMQSFIPMYPLNFALHLLIQPNLSG